MRLCHKELREITQELSKNLFQNFKKKVKHRGTGIKINSPVFNILKPPNP